MSILCSCCVLESALTIMVQSRLHHVLAYYIHMFEFNTILQAKSALAIIVNKVEEHFQQFVKLTDEELSKVKAVLVTSIKTKNLYVKLMDRQGSSDYHIDGFLEMLRHLTSNPDNMAALGSSTFIGLYHSMLLEPDLSGAAKEVLLLLEVVCGHPASKKAVKEENGQLLATLETLTANEDLQSKAIEVIWKLLNEDTVVGMYVYIVNLSYTYIYTMDFELMYACYDFVSPVASVPLSPPVHYLEIMSIRLQPLMD